MYTVPSRKSPERLQRHNNNSNNDDDDDDDNNNNKEDFWSAQLPFKVGAQGALQ